MGHRLDNEREEDSALAEETSHHYAELLVAGAPASMAERIATTTSTRSASREDDASYEVDAEDAAAGSEQRGHSVAEQREDR